MSRNKKDSSEKTAAEIQTEALDLIMKGAEILGWQVAIPGEEDVVDGIVIGTQDFVESVIGEDYDIYENFGGNSGSGEIH